MLDRQKLAKDISLNISKIFPDFSGNIGFAVQTWKKACNSKNFEEKVKNHDSKIEIPSWAGNLSDLYEIKPIRKPYSVLAVDGSQIYPDRHIVGTSCFLINIGGVMISYSNLSKFERFSKPKILSKQDLMDNFQESSFSRDLVDLKREELELSFLLEKHEQFEPNVCLIDGSLNPWGLKDKTSKTKEKLIKNFEDIFEIFKKKRTPVAGYISSPRSRNLANLLKIEVCQAPEEREKTCSSKDTSLYFPKLEGILDTQLLSHFLKKNFRTTIFFIRGQISSDLAFVYLNVGSEIVRIEFCEWIAQDESLVDLICSVALDQSIKGMGYPVCLSEAHEQAVVKGQDRVFFYNLLCKVGMENNKRLVLSPKALKKQIVGV